MQANLTSIIHSSYSVLGKWAGVFRGEISICIISLLRQPEPGPQPDLDSGIVLGDHGKVAGPRRCLARASNICSVTNHTPFQIVMDPSGERRIRHGWAGIRLLVARAPKKHTHVYLIPVFHFAFLFFLFAPLHSFSLFHPFFITPTHLPKPWLHFSLLLSALTAGSFLSKLQARLVL